MTKRTEKKAATKTKPTKKEPKMTKTEQPEVKEQLAALIAGTPSLHREAPAPVAQDPAKREAKKAARTERKPRANTSTVASPVALVHSTCEEMTKSNPAVARKDIIAALLAKGVNRHTASTQIQRWRTMQKAAAKK